MTEQELRADIARCDVKESDKNEMAIKNSSCVVVHDEYVMKSE